MRKLVIGIGVVVVLIVLLLVIGAAFLNVDRFRPKIQAELQAKLGRQVTLGELHLHLIPLSIKVDGLSIAESPAFPSTHPFATAQEVYASASLMSLIRGNPQINELKLTQPQIELIQNAQGIWNFSTLGNTATGTTAPSSGPASAGSAPAGSAPAGSAPAKSSSEQQSLTLDRLVVTNGQVAMTNLKTKSPRTVYNGIDVTLANFEPGKPFDVNAAIHFPGQGKEELTFDGKVGPVGSNAAQLPIDGKLSIDQVALAGVNSVAPGTIPPNTDAVATGAATITSKGGTVGAQGTLNLANAVVQGKKVDAPIEAQYNLTLDQNTDQISIASSTVKVGPTAVSLSGIVDNGSTPSKLNVKLGTNNASIAELSRLAALFGSSSNNNDQVQGTVTADLSITGTIKEPQIQGSISAPNIQAQQIALTNVKSNISMTNGVLQLNPLTGGIFGGTETGTVTVDTKPALPQCTVKSQFAGVDTNALLSAVSSAKNTLYGKLAADADLSFAIADSANLPKTLNGTLNFNVTDGRLQNVNVLNELAKVGKFLNAAPAQQNGNGTPLQKLAGTLDIHNGVAQTNNLVAGIPQGSLAASGSINLVDQGLNLHVNAVLANSFSKAVGGTGIGGYLNTALANKSGELVLPVIVTGNMSHPIFAPDVQTLAKMKLSSLLPTTGDPTKLGQGIAGSVLGGLLGGKKNANGQQQQNSNPLGGLLKGLGKR
jgi:AsmA protein